ncbi:electron transport complex protein RnfC [Mobilisporobacter senegalensis]|uniref:Ion-translocating oxidoreductase complex subunit C n=1 Tax=Mobilisporobacter senegalensis TaxID=1329262 RepID=A0A3N1XZ08_9FIRM|nr:electron transport complex subunit RsxC [Mobilisporobacter senegalensis]ROR31809.1 electron transport complex protein RnfC [Mobilisporobacter senegalensis]
MGLLTFKGGIHPNDGKDLSKSEKIKTLLPKGELVFPLSQHIGAPGKPVVAVGDKVVVGQIIAEASSFISANVISSVSGTVKAIEKRLSVSGDKMESIIIENDNEYNTIDGFGTHRDYTKLSKEEIRNIVKEAGIVGLGGAGFPTHVKLTPKDDSKIEYILVNGAECEPYLTSDYREMLEEPEKIVEGLKVVKRLFENAKALIVIEDNKPDAIEKIKQVIKPEDEIEVKVLKTKYPQGSERQLIGAVTGRKISAGQLPAEVGCLVDNIDTIIAIYNAVCKNIPLIRKIITVTGDAIANPGNFSVRLGTNYTELLEAAGGYKTEPAKVISGGPMMGISLFSIDVPVVKNSSALLCLTKDEVAEYEPTPCIKCGNCVSVCPCRLVPQKMYEYAIHSDHEGYEKMNGMECYECGCCSYICPAKIRLTQAFKETRRSIMKERSAKK